MKELNEKIELMKKYISHRLNIENDMGIQTNAAPYVEQYERDFARDYSFYSSLLSTPQEGVKMNDLEELKKKFYADNYGLWETQVDAWWDYCTKLFAPHLEEIRRNAVTEFAKWFKVREGILDDLDIEMHAEEFLNSTDKEQHD